MVLGIGGERAGEGGQGLVGAVELAERRAPVGGRRGEARHQGRGGAERRGGALHVVAAQPQLAQLEVRRRPVGRGGHRLGGQAAALSRSFTSMHALAMASRRGGSRAASRAAPAAARRAAGEAIAKCRGQRSEVGRRTGRRSSRRRRLVAIEERHLPPRAAPRRGFRRVLAQRAAIGGGDQRHVTPRLERVEPHLQHVERLGRDQPRAVGLRVLEGEVQVGHPDHGVGGPLVGRGDRMDERPVARRRRFHQRTIAASDPRAAPRRRAGPGTRRCRQRPRPPGRRAARARARRAGRGRREDRRGYARPRAIVRSSCSTAAPRWTAAATRRRQPATAAGPVLLYARPQSRPSG